MNFKSPSIPWKCRDRTLSVGGKTLVMGILNVTPDSFSDGGQYGNTASAVAHGLEMIEQGADILDVGGESTRPGAEAVSAEEEIRRVVPVIEELRRQSDGPISVDTMKAEVARKALEAGADIINDVSALTGDPDMAGVGREFGAGLILMHMQGLPRTMQLNPTYTDVVQEVREYLDSRLKSLVAQGLSVETMAIDPGIGFGKTVEHNIKLLVHLNRMAPLERPIIIGVSRKSFLGKITGREVNERVAASVTGMVYAVLQGAQIVRVHDVKESCDAVRVVDCLKNEQFRHNADGSKPGRERRA